MFIFTLFDTVAERSGPIFLSSSFGDAERQFKDATTRDDNKSLLSSHPENFELRCLGEYDDKTCEITKTRVQVVCVGKPRSVITSEVIGA